MAMIGKVRGLYFRDRMSVSEIARRTSLSRNTVKRWLKGWDGKEPKHCRTKRPVKMTPYESTVELALKADALRPKRERRTARALFEQIRAQGYAGGYTRMTDFIRDWRAREGAQVIAGFVPLKFALGEAFQFDWSEEGLVVGGVYRRLQVSHMKLCASRAFWLVAYPSQGHEMLFDAHTPLVRGDGRDRSARNLRQYEDCGRQGQEGQGSCGERAVCGDGGALFVRC